MQSAELRERGRSGLTRCQPSVATDHDPDAHPICGPLLEGGPALLAARCGVEHEAEYVSACHFCYEVRRALVDRFPQFLAPGQLYGF